MCSLKLGVALGLLTAVAAAGSTARAQDDEVRPPEDVNLETTDGVRIVATFYEGLKNENSVPVILVHGFEGARQDVAALAVVLQAQGHSVIAPDLRGHGDSVSVAGVDRKLDAEKMPSFHFTRMAAPGGDLDKVKSFLMERHNRRELNINKLCVVGVEMGAVVAVNWTLQDWSWPALSTGPQGQDVQALVLVSPTWNFKTLKFDVAMKHQAIRNNINFFIAVGKNDKESMTDSKRIHKGLERYRPEPEEDKDRTLYLWAEDTDLSGADLLNEESLPLNTVIAEFIKVRLADQPTIWKERRNPLD